MKASASLRLKLISYVLFLILFALICMSRTSESVFNRYTVHIINNFKNHTLEAHCKSADDDLGLQHIGVRQEFKWDFRVNYWCSTLFFCNSWWVGGRKSFDAFHCVDKFLDENCEFYYCRWRGQEDGIYIYSTKNKRYELMYRWEH